MSEDKFNAIIVGGGLAGLSASIVLAKAGLDVLVIERGDECGMKNVTGGRLYGHSLEKIIPNFAEEAPIERKVTKEMISLMTETGALNVTYASDKLSSKPENASYTVLRAKFDSWLAEKAEEAGAEIIPGIRVDDCIVEDGKVVGIQAGEDELYADVVILADGVNSLLAQKLGLKKELEPSQVAVGAKEVIKLSEEVINERFGLKSGEGASMMVDGDPTTGAFGGGFLYTNKDTVSLGVCATLCDIGYTDVSVPKMVDRFANHPAIAPLLEGGEVIEYSAHLVPEEGIHMVPKLYGDGVLVTGDAAGFCINLGFTVRGMDFAIESGRLAAETVIRANTYGNFSAAALSYYEQLINDSFIKRDLDSAKGFPTLLTRREMFTNLPEMVDDIAAKLFTVDGQPDRGIVMYIINSLAEHTTATDLVNMISDVLEAF